MLLHDDSAHGRESRWHGWVRPGCGGSLPICSHDCPDRSGYPGYGGSSPRHSRPVELTSARWARRSQAFLHRLPGRGRPVSARRHGPCKLASPGESRSWVLSPGKEPERPQLRRPYDAEPRHGGSLSTRRPGWTRSCAMLEGWQDLLVVSTRSAAVTIVTKLLPGSPSF